jgi:hypothetical protein
VVVSSCCGTLLLVLVGPSNPDFSSFAAAQRYMYTTTLAASGGTASVIMKLNQVGTQLLHGCGARN